LIKNVPKANKATSPDSVPNFILLQSIAEEDHTL
jgi:hypothetical protein